MGTVDFDAWCTPRALAQFAKDERARGNDVPKRGVGLLARMRRAGPEQLREPELPRAPLTRLEADAEAQRGASPQALLANLIEFARDPQYAVVVRTIAAYDTPRSLASLAWPEPRPASHGGRYFALSGAGWGVIASNDRGGFSFRPLRVDHLRELTLRDVDRLKNEACSAITCSDLAKRLTRLDRPSLLERLGGLLRRSLR